MPILHFQATEAKANQYRQAAQNNGLTLSELMRRLLDKFIASEARKQAKQTTPAKGE